MKIYFFKLYYRIVIMCETEFVKAFVSTFAMCHRKKFHQVIPYTLLVMYQIEANNQKYFHQTWMTIYHMDRSSNYVFLLSSNYVTFIASLLGLCGSAYVDTDELRCLYHLVTMFLWIKKIIKESSSPIYNLYGAWSINRAGSLFRAACWVIDVKISWRALSSDFSCAPFRCCGAHFLCRVCCLVRTAKKSLLCMSARQWSATRQPLFSP
jgi:hypothetical protein